MVYLFATSNTARHATRHISSVAPRGTVILPDMLHVHVKTDYVYKILVQCM